MTQNLSHVSYDSLFISVANCANAGELPFSALQKLVYWLAKYLSACKLSFTYQKFQELTLFAPANYHSTGHGIPLNKEQNLYIIACITFAQYCND